MGRWAGGWLGLGQYHSRDKASAYANWGKLLSLHSPVLALARPCYTNLTSLSLSLFLLLPLSFLPTPPTFSPLPSPLLPSPLPLTVLPRRRKLHIAVLTVFILNEFGWELSWLPVI